jgi:glycosyl transferase family 25
MRMPKAAWTTFVINLPEAVERRASLFSRLACMDIPFVVQSAIDGQRLANAEVERAYDSKLNRKIFKRPLSRAEIGCYLSHRAVWSALAASDAPGAFVLEDDAEPSDDLPKVMRAIAALDLDCHLIKLDVPRTGRRVAQLTEREALFEPRIVPAQTRGYALTREAAIRLRDTTLPFGRPVDLDIKHWWERGIAVLTVAPSPLYAVSGSADTGRIERSRCEVRRDISKGKRFIRNVVYQTQFHTALTVARLQKWWRRATK